MVSIKALRNTSTCPFGGPGITTHGRAVDLATGKCQADDRAAFLAAYYLQRQAQRFFDDLWKRFVC